MIVCLCDDIGTRLEVLAVNLAHHIGACEVEHIMVAFDKRVVVAEHVTMVVILCERIPLNTRAHRSVEDDDALPKSLL